MTFQNKNTIKTIKNKEDEVLRYEDIQGNVLAERETEKIFNTSRLTITRKGIDLGYMLNNGKIVKR